MSVKHTISIRIFAVFLLFLSACSQQATETTEAVDPEVARLQARAAGVTIIRDDFGVPHIYAKTDADAIFGMLYAQSEDDFNRVKMISIALNKITYGQRADWRKWRARTLYLVICEPDSI